MCGGFALGANIPKIAERFSVALLNSETQEAKEFIPSQRMAPSQKVPLIINTKPNHLTIGKWGFKSYWPGAKKSKLIINARKETLLVRPLFKNSFYKKRCLIPAEAFYEWQKNPKGKSQAYRLSIKKEKMFAMAGLWQEDLESKNQKIIRFVIITLVPNNLVAKVHNRMPAILKPGQEKDWLSNDFSSAELLAQLQPFSAEIMQIQKVS